MPSVMAAYKVQTTGERYFPLLAYLSLCTFISSYIMCAPDVLPMIFLVSETVVSQVVSLYRVGHDKARGKIGIFSGSQKCERLPDSERSGPNQR